MQGYIPKFSKLGGGWARAPAGPPLSPPLTVYIAKYHQLACTNRNRLINQLQICHVLNAFVRISIEEEMLKACLNFIKIVVSVQIVLSLHTPILSTHYNYHRDQKISFEASQPICVLG
jgi:hypothetical protein